MAAAKMEISLLDLPKVRQTMIAALDLLYAVEDADTVLLPDDVKDKARVFRDVFGADPE